MTNSEMVFEYLSEQGLRPEKRDDIIIFKYQMRTFAYFIDDDDETFFRLAMPGIFEMTDDNRMAVMEAMNEVNNRLKVVKVYAPDEHVWAATEILIDSTPVLDDMVPRLLNILMGAREKFYAALGV